MQYKVNSEIEPLRLVITHSPGLEHEYVTPENLIEGKANYLLFDDIIQIEKAKDEHQQLYDILHHFTDGNCFEFIDLLKVVLTNIEIKNKLINESPLKEMIAAVSVGIIENNSILDLNYIEDSNAETDMNIVMSSNGDFIEIQGTAEGKPFTRDQLSEMLALAEEGIKALFVKQKEALNIK